MLKKLIISITLVNANISLLAMQPEKWPTKPTYQRPKSVEIRRGLDVDPEKIGIVTKHESENQKEITYRTIYDNRERLSALYSQGEGENVYTASLGTKAVGGKNAETIFNILQKRYNQTQKPNK